MTDNDVSKRLLEIFKLVLGNDATPLCERQQASNWDSLKHIQLVFSIEDEFGIQFKEAEIPQLDSFKTIVEHIMEHRAS